MVREDNGTFDTSTRTGVGQRGPTRGPARHRQEHQRAAAGHRVAVIEALRSDGNLEFVAIAGGPTGSERLMGEATPLLMMDRLVAAGAHVDGWVHLPAERIDDETRAWVDQYGHTPDVPGGDGPDAWHPEDLLLPAAHQRRRRRARGSLARRAALRAAGRPRRRSRRSTARSR